MEQRLQAFILTAENLSMSKAADLAYVSPQCISGHIRGLEKEYQVKLFTRKPHLNLTPEGEHLLEMLYEMQMIENRISSSLRGTHTTVIGQVSLGVPISRYPILVPEILPDFKKQYPNVELKIITGFSTDLTWQVEKGALDMAITVQQENNSSLKIVACVPERFLCLIPKKLMKELYGETFTTQLEQFKQGISLQELSLLPLVQYPPTSRLRRAMDQYSRQTGTHFANLFESNQMEIFDSITRAMNIATIIAEMAYPVTRNKNELEHSDHFVYAFPLQLDPLNLPFNISLIHHKSIYFSDYKKYLITLIQEKLTNHTSFQIQYKNDENLKEGTI